MTKGVLLCFNRRLNHIYWELNECSIKLLTFPDVWFQIKQIVIFHPLEFMIRGSDAQSPPRLGEQQVGENCNYLI